MDMFHSKFGNRVLMLVYVSGAVRPRPRSRMCLSLSDLYIAKLMRRSISALRGAASTNQEWSWTLHSHGPVPDRGT